MLFMNEMLEIIDYLCVVYIGFYGEIDVIVCVGGGGKCDMFCYVI